MTPTQIAEQLGQTGRCVCPGFIEAAVVQATRQDLENLRTANEFHRASVGQGPRREVRESVRRDEVYWLDRARANAVQAQLWARIDLLKEAFNQTLFAGVGHFTGHYASYPPGGFYQRHSDAADLDSDRVVSLVLYLNHDWQLNEGGCLRLYHQGGHRPGGHSQDSHLDISPVGGTMVCFMSQGSEHEVLPSTRERLSFTGWFERY